MELPQSLPTASPAAAHKGLLREELLVLRRIVDLDLGRQGLDQNSCKFLGNNLPTSPIKDLLIVGLDIENANVAQLKTEDGQYQVGLSVLDTQYLSSNVEPQDMLQSYQFCIGPTKYFQRVSKTFCFGMSQHVDLQDLRTKVQSLVLGRDFVLVVHGGKGDVQFLQAAQINLTPLYILDTQKAAQHPLDLSHQCNIEEMLNLLGCPFGYRTLHVAGNDATFTLRALLLIASVDAAAANQSHLTNAQKSLLSTFEKIARAPPPPNQRQKNYEERRKKDGDRARINRGKGTASSQMKKSGSGR